MSKHLDKGKKDARRISEDRDPFRDDPRKKKLKPIERTKYRLKNSDDDDDGAW